MKFCAAIAAAAIHFGATDIATAQIEPSPAFRVEPPKKKAVRKAPPPAAAPAAVAPAAVAPADPAQGATPATTPAAPAEAAPAATQAAAAAISTHGTNPQKRPPYPPPKENCRNTESFESWKARFRKEAAARGVSRQSIAIVDGIPLSTQIIGRDRKQGAIFVMSFLDFQNKLATPNRVQSSKRKVAEHRTTFERAKAEFGVPASVITGFWALESDFGAGMGKLPIMPSLVALAYDCRRSEMFTEELIAALQIIDRGDMSPSGMIGSWAGEIGQTQFLPTRYLDYAIDYDGDGRINLFSNDDDVIGSTANYMKNLGWRANEPWLEEVRVTKDLPWDQADLAIKLPRSQWAEWGIEYPDGSSIPADNLTASLLLPMGRNGPAFLAYPNFGIYTEWNNSLSYATTAAYLATRIDGAPAMSRGRGQTNGLDAPQTKELQQILARRGYDVGKIDGLAGAKTRAAVKDMQMKLGFPADSYATPELLAALRRSG
ncbi:MAG: lytic murein transglycosylase [Hyphomicrobium sp.]|nr:MAG: lytic murein transglycosylase [Hyphomicrobium sp.]MBZ0208732.1 lytic murein transglycosylase [Hyphomicrobium sp.]